MDTELRRLALPPLPCPCSLSWHLLTIPSVQDCGLGSLAQLALQRVDVAIDETRYSWGYREVAVQGLHECAFQVSGY